MTSPQRVAPLCDDDLEIWTAPIESDARSPFADENALAERVGGIRGPHLTAGRLAAHAAILALGATPSALLRGDGGEVLWPEGIVGAIAHTPDLAVAAVGRKARYAGAGVDIELRARKMEPRTARMVAPAAEEQAWLDAPPASVVGDPRVALTSAKEVVFKACYPPTGVRLRFADAVVLPTEGGFEATLQRPLGGWSTLQVKRALVGEYVIFAGTLPSL